MSALTIIIDRSEVVKDIRLKSRGELALLTPEQRYPLEAGTDKDDEIARDILLAVANIKRVLAKYLAMSDESFADDNLGVPQEFVFEFDISDRRLDGKAQAVADLMHSYIASMSLSRYYASTPNADLVAKHSGEALRIRDELSALLALKKAPKFNA